MLTPLVNLRVLDKILHIRRAADCQRAGAGLSISEKRCRKATYGVWNVIVNFPVLDE